MDIHVLRSQPAQKVAFKDSSTVRVGNKLVRNKPPTQPSAMRPKRATGVHRRHQNQLRRAGRPDSAARSLSTDLVHGGFQPRLPTSLPPPGQQQQPSPLPRRQPVPLMPPAQLHPGAPQVVAPAPAVPLQSPPPSELMDVDPSAGPPSQAVAVQPVLQPLSLGTPKESDPAAPCPAPTQQPSTQRQETLPLFVGPDASSRPVPEAAPVVTDDRKVDIAFEEYYFKIDSISYWTAGTATGS
ncbi:vegetative cell wall protein gp1-like [Schistocerca americana]|uniref:vegetative cell wall protein gp1-like n=1 Tax=Schistocerca americana TaxID=7009 RepID=UPI001F4FDFCC|nr:vegetative cell wall protein gp1-like [Schistocerca americana]